MAVDKSSLSGFRDLLAEQLVPRQWMIDTIRRVYETYGFVPLETPAIERYETLTGKYGEEGEKLMYKFEDHGGRKLALRYDLTVPLARVVTQHRGEITFPYKRYQFGNVWRGESPQAGRYREFMQFDADVVGATGSLVDAEIISMMVDTMKALNVEAIVRVNNRCLLDALVEVARIADPTDARKLVGTIDKVERIGAEAVLGLVGEQFGSKIKQLVKAYLAAKGNTGAKLDALEKILGSSKKFMEGVENIREAFVILKTGGYSTDMAVFDQTIARGLDYYTGIIFETQLVKLPEIGSVCSGGRFDNLVKALGGPDLPAVGTSVGVDRLFTALEKLGKLASPKTKTKVFIINFDNKDSDKYFRLASSLREIGIPTEISSTTGTKTLRDQIGTAVALGVQYILIMGPDEIKAGEALVKDTVTRQQKKVRLSKIVDYFKT